MDDVIHAELVEPPNGTNSDAKQRPLYQPVLRFLFFWVCGSSALFATEVYKVNVLTPLGVLPFPASNQAYAIISRSLAVPFFGIAFAHGIVSLLKFKRHGIDTGQPGHWILYHFFVWICTSCAALALSVLFQERDISDEMIRASGIFVLLINSIVSISALFIFSETQWRLYFGIESSSSALLLLYVAGRQLARQFGQAAERAIQGTELLVVLCTALLTMAAAITLLIAAITDTNATRSRDRLHHIGITMWFAYGIYVLMDTLAFGLLG